MFSDNSMEKLSTKKFYIDRDSKHRRFYFISFISIQKSILFNFVLNSGPWQKFCLVPSRMELFGLEENPRPLKSFYTNQGHFLPDKLWWKTVARKEWRIFNVSTANTRYPWRLLTSYCVLLQITWQRQRFLTAYFQIHGIINHSL